MKKSPESSVTHCLNCGALVKEEFCHQCGQRVRDNSDRSLSRLLGDFFNNMFFLDNRFLLSMGYLFRFPGRMTVEFLDGKRKKFIPPVTLFLFFNLIYFLVSPLSDYSLSLYDQITSQPYSKWVYEWVIQKLENESLEWQDYSKTYQVASDNISKSIMIINVPLIALLVYLISFKKRRFYFDSLIFCFHFFSIFMASWILLDWVGTLINFLAGNESSVASSISFTMFAFVIPLLYAIFSIQKFMQVRWYWAILAGAGVKAAVTFANLLYRLIIFLLAFWTT